MFEGLFQPMHLIIILVIALIIFGPGKLTELISFFCCSMVYLPGDVTDALTRLSGSLD